ncbi:MAG: efflux RND transporter periplasmic adaptor subunit [Sphingobium sp.]|nr:efflux RND transporter periplasmic adaptor subunit [Sphingobium sp.]
MKAWMAGGWALGGAALGALAMWMAAPETAPDADDEAKVEAKAGGEAPEAQEALRGLTLDAKAQAAAGIKIAPVAVAMAGGSRSGYARAIDLSPLATLAADAEAARAAIAASSKEVARLMALTSQDQSAAPKELEAAQSQLAADRAKLTLACRKVGLDFGAGLARLGCDAISGLARDAAQGRVALVRIDMTQGPPPTAGTIAIGEGDDATAAHILGPAANADPQLQTSAALAFVRGPGAARLAVGRVLPVRLADGSAASGVLVPRTALMRADGGQFAYRASGGGRFTRVALSGGAPQAGGWFFPDGVLKPGDPIVVAGATTLLGLERGPQAGDD